MTIKYLGHASFLIKTKDAKVVMDPFDPKMVGLKFPKTEADIVTISHHHPDHDFRGNITGDPLVIDWPGESEKNGVRVFGYKSWHDKQQGKERGEDILYKVEAEDINILHCGDLGLVLSEETIDEIGEVDVLLVPVGGFYTIDPQEAQELVRRIEPSMVVPMHYKSKDHDPKTFAQLSPLSEFLGKYGVSEDSAVDQLNLKKEDLAPEEMKVTVLKVAS